MSSLTAEPTLRSFEVVDLCSVEPVELEYFWNRELALWRDRLLWDVSGAIGALRRALERGGLQGKVVRSGGVLAAYAYYSLEGDRGVVSGLVVSPHCGGPEVASTLVNAVLGELGRRRVRRVESQFICLDAPWLASCFEGAGFRTHWREFLRMRLSRPRPRSLAGDFSILPWKAWNLSEAAVIMQNAHRAGVDAEMNELYRTSEGCRTLLNNILRQRGCGVAVPEASVIARQASNAHAAGFAIVTEIASRQGHLAQVAVDPSFQRQGVGRSLLEYSLSRLGELGFETLSLMVSRGNHRALRLYRFLGFEPVFRFPVFSREL